MEEKRKKGRVNQIKGLICMIAFAVILIAIYCIDDKASNAEIINEKITSWNPDDNTYSKLVLDGKNNGYLLCKEGSFSYYQYERKDSSNEENFEEDKGQLLESGTYDFDKSYGWTLKKKKYKDGKVAEESVEDYSYRKEKVPFQQILQKGKDDSKRLEIVFDSGEYEMYGPFRLYSYTELTCEDSSKPVLIKKNNEAMFINVDDSDSDKYTVTGYKGAYKITLRGLNVDLDKRYSSVLKSTHASNYIVDNCSFYNGRIGHVLEFNAMKNVCVSDCKFEKFYYDSSGQAITRDYVQSHLKDDANYFIEVIQVEGDSSEIYRNNTPMGKYSWLTTKISNDNTSSKNIIIKNSKFKEVISGVGHHYYNDDDVSYKTNVNITGNTFEDIVYNAICLYGYKNIDIKDNYFKAISKDKIGGLRIFLKGCVDKDNEGLSNEFAPKLAKNNYYYSEKDDKKKKISELDEDDRRIVIKSK